MRRWFFRKVSGIRWTVNRESSRSTSTTVRLAPSRAMNPLGKTYFIHSGGASRGPGFAHSPSDARRGCGLCREYGRRLGGRQPHPPPKPTRSILTCRPGARSAKVVRSKVSWMASNPAQFPAIWVTVRQTPSTDTLAPDFRPSESSPPRSTDKCHEVRLLLDRYDPADSLYDSGEHWV